MVVVECYHCGGTGDSEQPTRAESARCATAARCCDGRLGLSRFLRLRASSSVRWPPISQSPLPLSPSRLSLPYPRTPPLSFLWRKHPIGLTSRLHQSIQHRAKRTEPARGSTVRHQPSLSPTRSSFSIQHRSLRPRESFTRTPFTPRVVARAPPSNRRRVVLHSGVLHRHGGDFEENLRRYTLFVSSRHALFPLLQREYSASRQLVQRGSANGSRIPQSSGLTRAEAA